MFKNKVMKREIITILLSKSLLSIFERTPVNSYFGKLNTE